MTFYSRSAVILGQVITPLRVLGTAMAAGMFGLSAETASQTLPVGQPVDSSYLQKFGQCDATNVFDGVKLPTTDRKGKHWYDCHDQSHLVRLDAVPATPTSPGAIIFTAKIARDDDGSPAACGAAHGPTDQCGTALMLLPTSADPCILRKDELGRCVPVNAAKIPYIAIPASGPSLADPVAAAAVDPKAFRRKTGIAIGDFAVVLLNGKVVSAIVADSGPWNKIGEGSAALLGALQPDGKPRTVPSGVTYIVFPGSGLPYRQLLPDTLADAVSSEACRRYRSLIGQPHAACH